MPLGRLTSLVLLGAAVYLYLILFRFPCAPVLLGGDQTFCWMNGQRILFGERPYLDFFQFTPPGADLVYFAAFKLFGARMWAANTVVLLLGVALCGICFRIATQVTEPALAALASFFFVVVLYGTPLNATHHWFSVLFIALAIAVMLPRRSIARLVAAGALIGLASFCTQSHAAAAGAAIAVFLLWERFERRAPWTVFARQEAAFLCGVIVAALSANAHYLATAGLAKLWFFQVTYVRQYLPHLINPFAILPQGWASRQLTIAIYVLVPLVYGVSLFRLVQSSRGGKHTATESESGITLLVLAGGALLAEVALSLNWLRLFTVSMPAVILLAAAVGRAGKMRACAVTALWIMIGGIAVRQMWLKQSQPVVLAALPGGTVALPLQAQEKLGWLAARTKPGDFFLHAAWPGVYLPLGLRNPLFLDVISAYQLTPPEYITRAVAELESKRVRYVLWPARMDSGKGVDAYLAPLRTYLQRTYRCSHVFRDGDQLLERW